MRMVTVTQRRVGRAGHSGRRGFTLSAVLGAGILLSACVAAAPVPPPPPPPTRGSTFPPVTAPAPGVLVEVARPPGAAASPGADHWYRFASGGGHSVELGVYLPAAPLTTPPIAVLALHGGNGLHRSLETLARGYAQQGFIGIAGCWFDQPEAELTDDAVSCSGGPVFRGTQPAATSDLDALLAAVALVPGVDPTRIAIVGHSYGAGAALMRAADRSVTEPIVSASGVLAREPNCCGTRAGDRYPTDAVSAITGPVFVVHAYGDPITPVGQAVSFLAALDTSRSGQPATPRVLYGAPAAHELPFQTAAYGGSTVATQFLADTTAWIVLRFP
jgi:dienelactone hydrolase